MSLLDWFRKRCDPWEHGRLGNGLLARRHRVTREIQFLIWKSGQQGHAKDIYYQAGSGHEFIPGG